MPRPLTPAEARERMTEVIQTTRGLDKSTAAKLADESVRRVFDRKDKQGN